MFPSTLLCLHADHVRNHYVLLLVCPLLPWITELPWSALLPWPPSRPPTPSLLLASVLHLRLHWALNRRVAISCPHTLNLSLPQAHRPGKTTPITLQFLKHAPSSFGHGIWQILLSPKTSHQEKVWLILSWAFTRVSQWHSTNAYRNTIPTVKSLKCQPCRKCRSRDLVE